jgi:AmiR/NasT family two-component response regulator
MDEIKTFMIRMKPELLERIKASARALGMSINAFIVQTLESVELKPTEAKIKALERRTRALEERVEEIERRLNGD